MQPVHPGHMLLPSSRQFTTESEVILLPYSPASSRRSEVSCVVARSTTTAQIEGLLDT